MKFFMVYFASGKVWLTWAHNSKMIAKRAKQVKPKEKIVLIRGDL